ncbi:MAG: response regulator [bacterium]
MDNPSILVIDGDPKNLQILTESLESAGFKVLAVTDGDEAWEVIHSQKPDIILSEIDITGLNGFQLLKKLQEDPLGSTIPLIFLTNRRDLEDRIKSLRVGVKDYMIKPLHVKEVIARVQMILKRINRMKSEDEESSNKLVGRLEEYSVEDLIEKFGVERRTGVLNLYDQNNRNGDLYFRDGAVVKATLGNFKAEKAVYQMLPWRKGHFLMTFKAISVGDEISVSNLGLLLQGFKYLQERDKLIAEIPALDTVLVKTAVFERILQKRAISTDALKFISLFDGKRTISQIMVDSNYDDLKTLERIAKLYQQGFVRSKASLAKTPDAVADTLATSQLVEPPGVFSGQDATSEVSQNGTVEEEDHLETPEPAPSPNSVEDDLKMPTIEPAEAPDSSVLGIPPQQLAETEAPVEVTPTNNNVNGISKIQTEPVEREEVPTAPFAQRPPEFTVQPESAADSSGVVSYLKVLLQNKKANSGQVVIICDVARSRQQLISLLTDDHYASKSLDSAGDLSVDIGQVQIGHDSKVDIIGVSTEQRFLHLLEQFSNSLVAYVVLISGDGYSKLGYIGYLINYLKNNLSAPHIIAIHRSQENKGLSLEFVRNTLRLEEREQLFEFEATEKKSAAHLISQLIPPESVTKSSFETNLGVKETAASGK